MNKSNACFLLMLPLLMGGCISQRSKAAKNSGYEKTTMVEVGPYQLHYGHHNNATNSDNFVLLAEGNWNIFSRYSEGNDVYLEGLPFIHFDRMSDSSLTNLQMTLWDANHKQKIALVDGNADGQWDIKIDYTQGKSFTWTNGQWILRHQMKETSQH